MTEFTTETLRAAVGDAAAAALIEALGGDRIYVPRHPDADHPLVLACGAPSAREIAERWHGETVYVPMSRRFLVRRLRGDGFTARQVARRLHISIITVRRYSR